jgi:maleate cis-trans isomerase
MYRIGLLVPSSNVIIEPDFYRMAPNNVSIHSARMIFTEFTPESLSHILNDAQRQAELLAQARVDVIVYGCSTCALIGGVDWEQVLIDQIKFNTGMPVLTVNVAMIDAIRAFGVHRVGVVTPYTAAINRLKRQYLEVHGLKVSRIRGLGLSDAIEIGSVEEEKIMPLVDDVSSNAELILIGCSGFPVIDFIEKIETQYDIPVVTSNQAGLWAALRGANIKPANGYGRLMMLA